MIFDCFTFFNELDLLKIRINEFSKLDVTHVLIESNYTFSGNKKPLYFSEKKSSFKNKKIKNFVFDKMPNNGNAWDNEKAQRNYIYNALCQLNAKDDDIVIISDADEIISSNAIKHFNVSSGISTLILDSYFYYINWLAGTQNWNMPKITTFKELKHMTVDELRNSGSAHSIPNAGWHFTYMGGAGKVKNKIESFSHQELNNESYNSINSIQNRINNSNSIKLNTYELLPEYLQSNISKFKHLIKTGNGWEQIFGWFDFQDIYDRFLDQAKDNDIIVEIGAYMGKSTVYLAEKIKNSGKKIKFYVIDCFIGEITENNENLYEKYLHNLEINDVKSVVKTYKLTSADAVSKFKDNSIKYIFIDGSHKYEDVKNDILSYLPKMKDDSIMAGHDYHFVKGAVDEVFKNNINIINASWLVENPKFKI